MKHPFILFLLAAMTFYSSCSSDDAIIGSGNLITESRDVENFEKVSSKGVFEVTITQGSTQSVEIRADDNIMNRVKAKVINNELQLYLDEGFNYSGITIDAHISATDMNGITNSGVGNMKVSNLDDSETFSIENFGTGNISIDGKVTDLKVVNEGSGDISAFDLQVKNASIEIEGSGSVETHCSDNLNVTVVGSGNVFYKGNPSINTSITGSGNVIDSN